MSGESKSEGNIKWNEFLNNINKGDNICIFTIGRFHPFHKGHKDLICDVMLKTKEINDMNKGRATAYVYLSATNKESRWITDEKIITYLQKKGKTPREMRAINREVKKIKEKIEKSEPLPTSYRFAFLHKMLDKQSCGPNLPNPIILYDENLNYSLAEELKNNFINGTNLTKGSRERLAVSDARMVRDRYGKLPSIKCLSYLKKQRKHNKVILLVGSDRVEAFKKYNSKIMEELFNEGNSLILQSGGERGDSGEGDKALDELETLFANMSIDEKTEKSKIPEREDYSGSLARKKALGNKDDIKQFLQMIDYTPDDDIGDILALLIKIRNVNGDKNNGKTKQLLWNAVMEIDNDNEFDKFAVGFAIGGPEKRQKRKLTRKRGGRRKRCSRKRIKNKIICHKGTKKNLKKLSKLTKKLKLRLTKCSKKRINKWKVKKTRKKY